MRSKSSLLGSTKAPTAARDQDDTCAPDRRDRHGFRGTPPPATFDLSALPNDGCLTELEVAACGRFSTNTLATWRRRANHPLRWFTVGNGFIRYRVRDVKAFLATGAARRRP